MQDHQITSLLVQAQETPLGVKVRTSNPQLLRNKLYAAMRAYPSLALFGIVTPPVGSENYLWLVRKEQRDGSSED